MMSFSLLRNCASTVLVGLFVVGCGQGNERLAEKSRIEGKVQAEAGVSAENANLAAKAQAMEADLATRQLFYQAVKGTYEGDFATERGDFKVRVTLVPSLPSSSYNRTRQLEEIASDLNNLSFHAQILQWNPANPLSAVGCRVENIRPDINNGEINIASSSCANLYKLQIADPDLEKQVDAERRLVGEAGLPTMELEVARSTASAIIDGKIKELAQIRGEIHPSTNAAIYTLSVKRIALR